MRKIYSVEEYIELEEKFQDGLKILRSILLKSELEETVKWSMPTYTINGKNVVGLSAFKNHFGLWFFNGVFLEDKHQLLINAQENKTKGQRQMRFTNKDEVDKNVVLAYINEAIENQKLGKTIKVERKSKTLEIPSHLKSMLHANQDVNTAFNNLTSFKQREYCEYIDSAKRESTKLSRIEKIRPLLLEGKGLNDKYR